MDYKNNREFEHNGTAAEFDEYDDFDIEYSEYDRIGGWLILVAIGTYISPILRVIQVVIYSSLIVLPIFNQVDLNWQLLLIAEALGNFLFTIFSFYKMFLFHKKKTLFPNFFIAFSWLNLLFLAADSFMMIHLSNVYYTGITPDYKSTVSSLATQAIIITIWTLYMKKSERVKNTFIK